MAPSAGLAFDSIVRLPSTGGFFLHSLVPCRDIFDNDLTELPLGIFDSLPLLTFLYVPLTKQHDPRPASFSSSFFLSFHMLCWTSAPSLSADVETSCEDCVHASPYVVKLAYHLAPLQGAAIFIRCYRLMHRVAAPWMSSSPFDFIFYSANQYFWNSIWNWVLNFIGCLTLLWSCVGLERMVTSGKQQEGKRWIYIEREKVQPNFVAHCHSLLSCRALNENDLTELPTGLFDLVGSLNSLYVVSLYCYHNLQMHLFHAPICFFVSLLASIFNWSRLLRIYVWVDTVLCTSWRGASQNGRMAQGVDIWVCSFISSLRRKVLKSIHVLSLSLFFFGSQHICVFVFNSQLCVCV